MTLDQIKTILTTFVFLFVGLILPPSAVLAKPAGQCIQLFATPDITTETAIFALGLDLNLNSFTEYIKNQTELGVFNYRTMKEFISARESLTQQLLKDVSLKDKYKTVEEWSPVFQKIILNLIQLPNSEKPILFNLDGYNLSEFVHFQQGIMHRKTNFTNAELIFILSDPNVFKHVRWFLNNRELSGPEIEMLFKNINPNLF